MPRLTLNSVSLRMLYLSCVKIRELYCPAMTEQKLALGGWVTQCQRVGAFMMILFGMTRPGCEPAAYRMRG